MASILIAKIEKTDYTFCFTRRMVALETIIDLLEFGMTWLN